MKKLLLAVSACAVLGLTTRPAMAQFSQPPTVSPWLNLNRTGGSAGLNYFTLVRPEFQFRGAINQMQKDIASNQEFQTGSSDLPGTGHASGFQTQMRYFGNLGAIRGTSMGGQSSTPLTNPLNQNVFGGQTQQPSAPRR